jgi:hypothetical protein
MKKTLKATELRIGNWVSSKEIPVQIEKITTETVRYCFGDFPISYIKPIPITEDWLLLLGFTKRDGLFRLSKYWVEFRNFDCVGLKIIFGCFQINKIYITYSVDTIEYVHQLQNLYFALTGYELKLQETSCL